MSDFFDEDLMKDYFDEANSQIEMIEDNLLILEKNPANKDAIDSLFRAAHTLKGSSATVQLEEIAKFTHVLEDCMDEIRSGKVKVTAEIIDTLLSALDIIKNMVSHRSNGNVFNSDISKTVESLKSIAAGGTTVQAKPTTKQSEAAVKPKTATDSKSGVQENNDDTQFKISEYDILEITESNSDNQPVFKVIVTFDENNPMRTVGAIQVFTSLRDIGMVLKTYPEFDELYSEAFHPKVMYVLATEANSEKIHKFTTVSDTTTDIKIIPFNINEPISTSETNKPSISSNVHSGSKTDSTINNDSTISDINKEITQSKNNDTYKNDSYKTDSTNKSEDDHKEVSQLRPIEKDDSGLKPGNNQQTGSVLRVDAQRIDDLLNLAGEIVINKATFNQINNQFSDNIENLGLTVSEYRDKIKKMYETIPDLLEQMKNGTPITKIKKGLQKEMSSMNGVFDTFANSYKTVVEKLKATTQNLDRVSVSLREGVMRVRMVQIKQIFSRFPRLVRDLSRDLNKEVELILEGEDTEVDKGMIDDLIDPMIHIVRNAIDHGIETPEDRVSKGKNPKAKLRITAMNEGNLISIYVKDDGRGIDVNKISKKAIEKGLITKDRILKETEILNLLFEPGFSTAEKVTSVSGRGVGLDVVKRNIEKLSGNIRIQTEINKETSFIIKIPLTLAIIQGLMVKVKEEKYVIPISSVIESIRVKPEEIKRVDNTEVINFRDGVLSLLRLNRVFKLGEDDIADYHFIVIIGSGDKKVGLLVDSLIGEEDIVIKPLKDKFTNVPGIAGATILGDGTVSLILEVTQLIELGLKTQIEEISKL